ncbi:MAG: hypothetical protein ABIE70_03305 [bacterium]
MAQRCTQQVGPAGAMIWLLVSLLIAIPAQSSTPLTWGDLEPGAYGVGFKTIEQYDQTRSYQPKRDYFGSPVDSERARPVQACIWYPAVIPADDPVMTFGEYLFPNPADDEFFRFVSAMQNRYNGFLIFLLSNDQGLALDALSIEMAAVSQATPSPGQFPMIIYHGGIGRPFFDNFVLCEYLASYGFVVVSTHSMGAFAIDPEALPVDYEAIVRDRELAATMARQLDFVDPERTYVVGADLGCLTALSIIMRQTDVDALVLAGSWDIDGDWPALAQSSPGYNPTRITIPTLRLYLNEDDRTLDFLRDSCRYAERDLVHLPVDTLMRGLSCDWTIRMQMLESPEDQHPFPDYYQACRMIAQYLTACLDTATGFGAEAAAGPVQHIEAEALPPTWAQLVGIFRGRSADEAIAIYDRFNKAEPGIIPVDEAAMNMIGYGLLQAGQAAQSQQAFRINAEAYPRSSNVWDSYADGCLAAGDTAQAVVCYQTLLRVLPEDKVTNEQLKQTLQTNAEQGLQRLKK